VALAAVVVLAQGREGHAQTGAAAGSSYAPGRRVLIDAHNAYPTEGRFEDRIDRALATGMPLAIEQDLFWLVDPRSGVGRSVVAHVTEEAAGNPSFEDYFFKKVAPVMDKALAENKQADWPLITLNLDFKSNEPEHHAAVWALLGKYERWLTTAERTATPDVLAPLRLGPMLVLTGSNDAQQISFNAKVPVGQRLRVFGATTEPEIPGANRAEKAKNYAAMPIADVLPKGASNYQRWVNFSWGVIEAGGIPASADWTPAEAERVKALVARAHALGLWIRFYTLNGHSKEEDKGWGAGYNFGSLANAQVRWKAAIDAGTDFIASDMFEALAHFKQGR
jgi:hypothetical protein